MMKAIDHHWEYVEQKIKREKGDLLTGQMQIWHVHRSYLGKSHGWAIWPCLYSLVCAVRTDDLDEAFRWTNDQTHWERDGVTLFSPYGWRDEPDGRTILYCPRSSCPGDVFVTPGGRVYGVLEVGFDRLL